MPNIPTRRGSEENPPSENFQAGSVQYESDLNGIEAEPRRNFASDPPGVDVRSRSPYSVSFDDDDILERPNPYQIRRQLTFQEMALTPTRTFDTVDTCLSDSVPPSTTTPSSTNSKSTKEVTINHKIDASVGHGHKPSSSTSKCSTMLSIRTGAKIGLGLAALLTAGSAAYFFSQFLTIPGLNDQIEDLSKENEKLETEVDRLSAQVNRLSEENDRYKTLNMQLNDSVVEIASQARVLNASLITYEQLNEDLKMSIKNLNDANQNLSYQVDIYKEQNSVLNTTRFELSMENARLEANVRDFRIENKQLLELLEQLNNETDTLKLHNSFLNSSVGDLQIEIQVLISELNRLDELNDDLTVVAGFLNETAIDIKGSLENVTDFLAESISANRAILMKTIHNNMQQRVNNWDCGFLLVFGVEDFVSNGTIPINDEGLYYRVIRYIDDRVLDRMCLDRTDFEEFLNVMYLGSVHGSGIRPINISAYSLISGVQQYTAEALKYYFDGTNDGLTTNDWINAGYDCFNLSIDLEFKYF